MIIIIINTSLWHTNLEAYIRLNVDAVHCQHEWIVAYGYACGDEGTERNQSKGIRSQFLDEWELIGRRMSVKGVRSHSQTHHEALNHIMSRSQICETYLPCYVFL